MGTRLLVDGYNLARSGPLFLSADPVTPEGREELCGLLSVYARGKGLLLTVVFDGGKTIGTAGRGRTPFKGGTALYSAPGETADDAIRALARDAPPGTVVVTSDRGLAGTLSARRMVVVSCGEFAARLADHLLAEVKGAGPGDDAKGKGARKGEGRRLKKRERERARILKKL